jgi:hypothetical protein
MTSVALSLAAEQVVARLLLLRELRLASEHCVELRRKHCHFGRDLVAGDRLRHLIESGGNPAVIGGPR